MRKSEKTMHTTAITGALLTGAALCGYFLIMRLIGLAEIVELRFLNYVIVLLGMYLTIKTFNNRTDYKMEYLEGLGLGFYYMFLTAGIFGGFMWIYLSIDKEFFQFISEETNFGNRFHPILAAFYVVNEIIGAGVISILIVMQTLKRDEKSTSLEEVEGFDGHKTPTEHQKEA